MGFLDILKQIMQTVSGNGTAKTPKKPNKSISFLIEALPQNVDELMALPEASLDTPFKTAALTVCALCRYASDPETGIAMLNALKGPQPLTTYEKQFLHDRFMDGKKYIPFSYFAGAKPENDYTPTVPYKITVSDNPYSYDDERYAVMYIVSGGADSARQVKCRKKGDQWFLWEQFLLSDIRKPKSEDPWA